MDSDASADRLLRAGLRRPGKQPLAARLTKADVLRVVQAALPDDAPTRQTIVTQVVCTGSVTWMLGTADADSVYAMKVDDQTTKVTVMRRRERQ